jgi:hypothetical protein
MNMLKFLPPRLRAPVYMLVVGVIAIGVGVAVHGWVTVLMVGPLVLVVVVTYYVASGRDSEYGAMVRHGPDERQKYRQLQVQALAGRVMSAAAAIAYLVAIAIRATLWPFAVAIGLVAVSQVAGWVIYRDRPDGREQQAGH